MRIVFFGTPALSVATLQALVEAGHDIALVVTGPDRRRGRGSELSPTPVKAAATALGLKVSHRIDDALEVDADIGVLVAFGKLIKPHVLERMTIINLHPSLLPRWRGATPVEAAILAGDERTGICLMQLVEEMDAGPIYESVQTHVGDDETAAELYSRLFDEGNRVLVQMLAAGLPVPESQEGEITYCGKTSAEDFHIDWTDPAVNIARLARVGMPWSKFRNKRIVITRMRAVEGVVDALPGALLGSRVQTGDGLVELLEVKPEGKATMNADAWVNGLRATPDEIFSAKEEA